MSKLSGFMTVRESEKVKNVIKKYNTEKEFSKKRSVGVGELQMMPDSLMESKRRRKRR